MMLINLTGYREKQGMGENIKRTIIKNALKFSSKLAFFGGRGEGGAIVINPSERERVRRIRGRERERKESIPG